LNVHVTNRISAHLGTHAVDLTLLANQTRWGLDLIVRKAWKQLFRSLKPGVWYFHANRQHVQAVLTKMQYDLWSALHKEAIKIWQWTHNQQANILVDHLPQAYVRPALVRVLQESNDELVAFSDGSADSTDVCLVGDGIRPAIFSSSEGVEGMGGETPAGIADTANVTILEARKPPRLTTKQERALVHARLFPKPKKVELQTILHRILPLANWLHVGDDGHARKLPQAVANVVAGGLAQGRTVAQVAGDLRPLFEGSRSRANMTARTLSAYINTERTLAACETLGGTVIGYIVHDLGGPTARHDHSLRSGTAYYRRPQPGEWGTNVMPHPPVDNGGPNEEQTGIRKWCRCFLVPIFASVAANDPEAKYFVDKAQRLIPDPSHYENWWKQATPQQKEIAGGVKRLRVARQKLGREPEWIDIISAFDGRLLKMEEIDKETPYQRNLRLTELRRIINQNKAATLAHVGV
jgi:hypothetical protein